MPRLILLDSGPLGLVTNPRNSEETRECAAWLRSTLAAGVRVMVPEIADYEVRRELIRAGRRKGLARLDQLVAQLGLLVITSAVWKRSAELWASARRAGMPTAADAALDGDVILAALVQISAEAGHESTVATTNLGHLGRFVDARHWRDLG